MDTLNETIITQKIDLIDGCFTSSEAADIINEVLKVKINFHKLKRLSITEGNNADECAYDSGRIDELLHQQEIANQFFSEARVKGKKITMRSEIYIEIED